MQPNGRKGLTTYDGYGNEKVLKVMWTSLVCTLRIGGLKKSNAGIEGLCDMG